VHCVVPEGHTVPGVGGRIDSPLLLEEKTTKSRITLDVVSHVAWHSDNGPGTKIGVEFSNLNSAQVDQIERFLAMFDRERGS